MTDDGTRVSDTDDRGSSPVGGEGRRGSIDDTVPASSEDVELPTTLPTNARRYRLGEELGRGGMGRVVEAFDTQLGRTVAMKEVLAGRGGIDHRFFREIQITARLEHPAIVPVYDSGVTAEGRPFYVMRKVTGRPLDDLIARSTDLSQRLAQLPAVLAAIDAVAHAHRRGVIHRDLKPANILVGELGETVVIDWGLAKVIGEDDEIVDDGRGLPPATVEGRRGVIDAPVSSVDTQIGSVFGTPGFMAPEQARGELLGKGGDVYALGATLYQLLAGKPPHRGKSATEVLSSTMSNAVVSFDLPGAPADLVAIVKKALAFEARDRYPDAALLGEDVRRFLAGQLVAAHQYTRRQRLGRFARRHRGVLGVVAIATIAVAGLAWYGVHRIVDERDRADEERRHALAESETSKQRLVAVQDRDERRTIANARALVTTNPTAAIATLKQLPPSSKHTGEARTVAQSAVARGVAWGQQTPSALTFQASLSPSGDRLFQLTSDGWARLWDLDRHKLAWQRREPDSRARMTWVSDGKHLIVAHEKAPPEIVDVVAVSSATLPIASLRAIAAAANVDRIVYADAEGVVHRFDVGARADAALPVHVDKSDELAISSDGTHFAVSDSAKRVTVYSIAGAELAHRDGAFYELEFSDARFAAFGAPEVVELDLATAAWTAIPLPTLKYAIARGGYLGDDLVIQAGSRVYTWRTQLVERMAIGDTIYAGGFALAGDLAIAELSDARLRFSSGFETGEIPLPMSVTNLRLIGRPKQQRLVVVGAGVLLDLPLDGFVSQPLPKSRDEIPWFVTDDALLYLPSGGDALRWLDLSTRKETIVQLDQPVSPILISTDPHDGRALLLGMHGMIEASRMDRAPTQLLLVTHGQAKARVVAEGAGLWGLLLDGGGVAYVDGSGKLFGQIGEAAPRELGPFDGKIVSLVARGRLGYVAYTDTGQLVRGSLENPSVEKVFARKATAANLAVDGDRTYIAIGTRLSRWDADLQELHDFGKPITGLLRGAGGVIVELDGGEYFTVPDGTAPVRMLSVGSTNVALGDGGHALIAFGQSSALQVVELPSRIMWSIPASIMQNGHVTMSPTARTLVYEPQQGAPYSLVRALVAGPADLGTWLDELTNATADESGLIVWPWQ